MMYWDMIMDAYWEIHIAEEMARNECINHISKGQFDKANQAFESHDKYNDCCMTALKML